MLQTLILSWGGGGHIPPFQRASTTTIPEIVCRLLGQRNLAPIIVSSEYQDAVGYECHCQAISQLHESEKHNMSHPMLIKRLRK
jgi:hypothetical protein